MIRDFFMAMRIPTVTQQEHKVAVQNGKPRFYEPAELKAARAKLRDYLAGNRPKRPLEGAVYLKTVWCFESPGGLPDGAWKITKPDTDNLVKMLKDEMTRLGFWKNDAQVCCEQIEKRWTIQVPGIYVFMEELDGEDEIEEATDGTDE